MSHHFLSYSRVDGSDLADRVTAALATGPVPVPLWRDCQLVAGAAWDDQIVEAIRTCDTLLFLMTVDSVRSASVCRNEWLRALKYKKPVVPLLGSPGAELPFLLEPRQWVDLSADFDAGIERLRRDLAWMASPAGVLHQLELRLQDAVRDAERAGDEARRRHAEADMADLRSRVEAQRRVVADLGAAEQEVAARVARGIEDERRHPPAAARPAGAAVVAVNHPPGVAPRHFQDRHVETGLLADFLRDEVRRLAFVVGRGGSGKTAMVCRLLKGVETGAMPDDGEPVDAAGVVYLSEAGERRVTLPNLLDDVARILPADVAAGLQHRFAAAQASAEARVRALLEVLPAGGAPVVVLLDNFEGFVDQETMEMVDGELEDGLRAVLGLPQPGLKVVVTTRMAPRDVLLVEPARQMRIDLDEGLPSPYAEAVLRGMDVDGNVGLRDAPDDLLDRARRRTAGYPRALEALFAILSADRSTSLEDVLAETTGLPPANVVEALVGEAFSRLSPPTQQVMEALAVYGRPVPAAAVDWLRQPFLAGVDSAPGLARLVNMHLVRREAGRFHLHPVDRAYALARVPRGEPSDRAEDGRFTQVALLRRAADWFRESRKPKDEWRSVDDLAAPMAEFELRVAAGDHGAAADVLFEVEFDFLIWRGHAREAFAMHQQLEGHLAEPRHRMLHAYGYGQTLVIFGPLEAAVEQMRVALALARDLGDAAVEAGAGGWIGECHRRLGHLDEALTFLRQAVARYDPAATPLDRSFLLELSLACAYGGATDEAVATAERLRRLAAGRLARQERGQDYAAGQAHDALALAYLVLRRHDDALAHSRRAHAVYTSLGAPEPLGYASNVAGLALLGLGRVDDGRRALEEALAQARAHGNPRLEGLVLFNLAVVDRGRGDLAGATARAEQAVAALGLLGRVAESAAAAALLDALRAAAAGDRRTEAEALVACVERTRGSADLHVPDDLLAGAQGLAEAAGADDVLSRIRALRRGSG